MSTIYYSRIEIDFSDETHKNNFKNLTNTEIGKNELLDFKVVFPVPSQITQDEKELELFMEIFWDGSESFPFDESDDTAGCMEEDGLFLRYYVATKSRPPIRFIKELYMHYEGIRRIRLFYNSEDDTIFLNENEDGRCEVKNCGHDDCTWHFVDWKIEMDWSDFPHPIFEVQNTLLHLRKLYPNESDAMIGQIYQYLIGQLSFFARYNSSTIIRSRSRFEEQAMGCGNEYLALTALTGNHKLPDKMPHPAATKNGKKKYTNLLVKYGKFNVRAKRNDPLLKRKKKS